VYVCFSRYCNIDLCEGSYMAFIFTSERPSEVVIIHQSKSARQLFVAAVPKGYDCELYLSLCSGVSVIEQHLSFFTILLFLTTDLLSEAYSNALLLLLLLSSSSSSNPGGGEIYCTRPDRPLGPPSHIYSYNGCLS
jgi:hypothetical protein